jgi:hypothetical protein
MRLKPAWYVPVVRNLPVEDWPIWVVVASLFRAAGDRGIGDTLGRELGGVKTEAWKRHHEAVFGLWSPPCSCPAKLRTWNRLYPYAKPAVPAPRAAT